MPATWSPSMAQLVGRIIQSIVVPTGAFLAAPPSSFIWSVKPFTVFEET